MSFAVRRVGTSKDADFLLHWRYRGSGEDVDPSMLALCTDPGQIARMAQTAGARRLYLTHFRVHMDSAKGHAAAVADLNRNFSGESGIVEDLQMFDL